MSVIDTPPVRTTSPARSWGELKAQLDTEWATKVTNAKQQARPIAAPTAEELRTRLGQYNGWLDTTYVQNHGALADWVKQQKAAVLTQLADLTAAGAA